MIKDNYCKKILNEIKNIDTNGYIKILDLIITKNIKFTENNDGCFIDLSKCTISILKEILLIINQCKEYNDYNTNIIKLTEEAKKTINLMNSE